MEKEARISGIAYDAEVSDYYADRASGNRVANEFTEMPATFKLLGDVKGKKVLDAGCGPGLYAKRLLRKGAKVEGFDVSPKSIEIAKRIAPKASFQVASVTNIPFKRNAFDIVVCSLVLDHVSDINKAFKEFRRVLKPKGIVVFSTGNPLFSIREDVKIGGKSLKVLGYTKKGSGRLQVFGDYFKRRTLYPKWSNSTVPEVHRTYEDWIDVMLKNKFTIVGYKDAKPIPRAKKVNRRHYNIYSKLPWFTVWKLQK